MSVGQIIEFTQQLAEQRKRQEEATRSDKPELDEELNEEPLVFEPTGSLIDTSTLDSSLVFVHEESAIIAQARTLFEQAVLPEANTKIDQKILERLHSCANMLIPLAPIYLASRMNTSIESLHSRLKQFPK